MKELKRIFVIGHPAAGKAYFSKYLADRIGYQFINADMELEHRIGLPIKEILGQSGLERYNMTQEQILNTLSKQSGTVVGLDCHLGNTSQVRKHLKNACIIFLKTDIETQVRRSGTREPLTANQNYADLFKVLHDDRDDYYNDISDLVLLANEGNIDSQIDVVIDYFKQNEFNLVKLDGLSEKELIYFKFNTDIPVRISEQQAICLKFLSQGNTAKEIAREMDLSYRTIEVYIAQLKEKLECDSSKDLISLYLSKH